MFDGHRQLELMSAKNSLQQELDSTTADVREKNSVITQLHNEVTELVISNIRG